MGENKNIIGCSSNDTLKNILEKLPDDDKIVIDKIKNVLGNNYLEKIAKIHLSYNQFKNDKNNDKKIKSKLSNGDNETVSFSELSKKNEYKKRVYHKKVDSDNQYYSYVEEYATRNSTNNDNTNIMSDIGNITTESMNGGVGAGIFAKLLQKKGPSIINSLMDSSNIKSTDVSDKVTNTMKKLKDNLKDNINTISDKALRNIISTENVIKSSMKNTDEKIDNIQKYLRDTKTDVSDIKESLKKSTDTFDEIKNDVSNIKESLKKSIDVSNDTKDKTADMSKTTKELLDGLKDISELYKKMISSEK